MTKSEQLVPDSVRADLLAAYSASVRDSPEVYRALVARGALGQLGDVATEYAGRMVGEVERLCHEFELGDEIGRCGFWPAWRTFIPRAMGSEPGREWLPSHSLTLSGPEQNVRSTEAVSRKPMGFQRPVAASPAVVAGLSAGDLERIVTAVSAAVRQPPVINLTMPNPEPSPDVEVLNSKGEIISRTRKVQK